MKRFLAIASVLGALLIGLRLAPHEWFSTLTNLPMHPLMVHFAVVLGPIVAIWSLVLPFIKNRGEVLAYVTLFATAAAAKAAVVTMQSGEALEEYRSVSNDHEEWGERFANVSIALYFAVAVYLVVRTYTDNVLARRAGAAVTAFLAIATLVFAILSGHSGASSVWGSTVSSESDSEEHDDSDGDSDSTASSGTDSNTPVASGYTLAEVAERNSPEDCWVAIEDGVYDLTKWIALHPGGEAEIVRLCGRDGTAAFADEHAGESEATQELADYRIADYLG